MDADESLLREKKENNSVDDFNEFFEFLNMQTEKSAVSGEPCKYLGSNVVCPGKDSNCLQTKTKHCLLYKGYEENGGVVRYFIHQIKKLKDKGEDISDLVDDVKAVRLNIINEKYMEVNSCLNSLNEKIENRIKEDVLSS